MISKEMNKVKQFGETVEGYDIPVLNEREIRASAGILFLFLFISWMLIIFKENFILIKYFNFSICLGCLFYHWFNKEKTQYCPGEICDVKARQEIQKTSFLQIGIVIGFLVCVLAAAYLFNDGFSAKPTGLGVIVKSVLSI